MAKKAFVYDGSQWVDIAQSTADLSNYANMTTTPISGFRNDIINGGMDVWQRGTSFTANSIYTADRWWFAPYGTSVAATIARLTSGLPDGFRYGLSMKAPSTTSANYNLFQPLETSSVIPFRNKTVTFSFYYKIPVNFTSALSANVMWSTATDTRLDPGTGTILLNQSLTNTTSWTRFQATFTVPATASSLTIGIVGYNNVVQNAELQITGVQLEEGSIATPFEQRPIGTELALCQRYYQRITPDVVSSSYAGFNDSTTTMVFTIPFIQAMRTKPVALETSGTASDYSVRHKGAALITCSALPALASASTNYINLTATVASGLTAGEGSLFRFNNANVAYLGWSAEI